MDVEDVPMARLTRSEDVWFEDGTVIIQTENTLFRVYSGLLSKHSPFFKHLFSLPQPSDAERWDDCPIVKLAGDAADDVHDFLVAIHQIEIPDTIMKRAGSLAAILELSSKYEVIELRRKVIRALAPFFPSTLPDYLALRESLSREGGNIDSRWPLYAMPALVAVANAVSTSAPQLLPFALLQLLRRSDGNNDVIFNGVLHNDKRLQLKPHLQVALVNGKVNLTRLAREKVYPTAFVASCIRRPFFCDSERVTLLSKLYRWDGFIDPIRPRTSVFASFCPSCKETFDADAKSGREVAWAELPQAFGLGSWQELEAATNAA